MKYVFEKFYRFDKLWQLFDKKKYIYDTFNRFDKWDRLDKFDISNWFKNLIHAFEIYKKFN